MKKPTDKPASAASDDPGEKTITATTYPIISDDNNFSQTIEDVQFGVLGGVPYALVNKWSKRDRLEWGSHQLLYYSRILLVIQRWMELTAQRPESEYEETPK